MYFRIEYLEYEGELRLIISKNQIDENIPINNVVTSLTKSCGGVSKPAIYGDYSDTDDYTNDNFYNQNSLMIHKDSVSYGELVVKNTGEPAKQIGYQIINNRFMGTVPVTLTNFELEFNLINLQKSPSETIILEIEKTLILYQKSNRYDFKVLLYTCQQDDYKQSPIEIDFDMGFHPGFSTGWAYKTGTYPNDMATYKFKIKYRKNNQEVRLYLDEIENAVYDTLVRTISNVDLQCSGIVGNSLYLGGTSNTGLPSNGYVYDLTYSDDEFDWEQVYPGKESLQLPNGMLTNYKLSFKLHLRKIHSPASSRLTSDGPKSILAIQQNKQTVLEIFFKSGTYKLVIIMRNCDGSFDALSIRKFIIGELVTFTEDTQYEIEILFDASKSKYKILTKNLSNSEEKSLEVPVDTFCTKIQNGWSNDARIFTSNVGYEPANVQIRDVGFSPVCVWRTKSLDYLISRNYVDFTSPPYSFMFLRQRHPSRRHFLHTRRPSPMRNLLNWVRTRCDWIPLRN